MNDLYKSDTFFFITSIAVILIAILTAVFLAYLIKIMSDIKYIIKRARTETDLISQDLDDLRHNMKTSRFGIKALFSFLTRVAGRRKRNKE